MDKEQYLSLRKKYLPEKLKLVFVLESPPASGLYFYDENGKTSEPLFAAMMKLLNFSEKNKKEGLEFFQKEGYIIVDATYEPVNRLKGKQRNDVILRDFDALIEDLENLTPGKQVPIVLVKANICRLLEQRLEHHGFKVKNNGIVVPFPSTGQQKKFHEEIGKFYQHGKDSA